MSKTGLNNLSEAELLDLYYIDRNDSALGALLNRYLPFVFATCVHYLKNREKAKDASSAILEKMLNYFKQKEVKSAKALILISAKNHCLSLLKQNKYSVNIEGVEDRLVASVELDEKILKESTYELLEKCLNELKPFQKESVKLFYLQKKSYQEIEKLTGQNIKQVKSNLQNGKRMLRNLMLEKMSHEKD